MKPTSSFKINKQTKRFMTTILDDHKRGQYKRAMIEAQLSESVQPKREKTRRDSQGE